jgi:hypothetical protein
MVTLFVVAGLAWSADDTDTRLSPSKAQGSVQSGKSGVKSEDQSKSSGESHKSTDDSKVTDAAAVSEDVDEVALPVSAPEKTKEVKGTNGSPKRVWLPTPPAPEPSHRGREPENRGGWPSGWNDHPRGGRHDHGRGWHSNPWRSWHPHHRWDFWMGPVFIPYPVHIPEPTYGRRHGRGVYVRYNGDDELGADVARALRGQLSDHGLRTVYSADEARLEFYIVSLDMNESDPGMASAVSVTYLWMPGNRFITTQLLDVPSSDVDEVADYLAGHAQEMIDEYR